MSIETKVRILKAMSGVMLFLYFALWWFGDLETSLASSGLTIVAWVVLGLGILVYTLSATTLARGGTKTIIDTGIYSILRHPMYGGIMLMFLSMMLFIPHLVIIVVAGTGIACMAGCSILEERLDAGKFGDAHRKYRETVPRINFVLGSARLLRRQQRRSE